MLVAERRMGVNGAALAKLLVTVFDCGVLYFFAWRLKAFHVRDLISGPLFGAIVTSGGVFAAVYFIHSVHVNLIMSGLLLIVCFLLYMGAFWVVAVDLEDRGTLLGFWRKGLLRLRRAPANVVPLVEVGK